MRKRKDSTLRRHYNSLRSVMMHTVPIRPDLTVEQLLTRLPETARVFVRHGMSCVGCDMSVHDTLRDAAREYRCELTAFLHELEAETLGHHPRGC